MTLRHIWGEAVPFRLLTHNLREVRDNVKIQILPKTFLHAINFTRSLGVRYLWVDTLCIIQDSQEDWAAHSLRMGRIYSESLLNIAVRVDAAASRLGFPFAGSGAIQLRAPAYPIWLAIMTTTPPPADALSPLLSRPCIRLQMGTRSMCDQDNDPFLLQLDKDRTYHAAQEGGMPAVFCVFATEMRNSGPDLSLEIHYGLILQSTAGSAAGMYSRISYTELRPEETDSVFVKVDGQSDVSCLKDEGDGTYVNKIE